MNYEQDIRIDQSALDVEWLDQPSLVFRYGKLTADWEKRMDSVKRKLDVTRAELDARIRRNPENFQLEKVTEIAINNAILVHPDYEVVYHEYLEVKYELDMCRTVVRALQDKKSALENLVKLHGQNYFAGPSVPRDLSREWENRERQKQANISVGAKMQRQNYKPKK